MRNDHSRYWILSVVAPWMLLAALPGTVAGAEEAGAATDEAELAALLSIVEEETELATRSRMNSDYVPGIVTILHGDDLEALGIRTVWEALGLVPGLQPMLDEVGAPSIVVRGIGFPFNSGNLKVQVNSVAISQAFSGSPVSALYLPIEMVDRIEIIRGPGSSIYGNFAFMGLVNVITRQETRPVFARLDDDNGSGAGGLLSWRSADRPLWLDAAVAAWEDSEDGPTHVLNGEEDRRFAHLALGFGELSLRVLGLRRDFASERDLEAGRPPPRVDDEHWVAQLRHHRSWSTDLETEASLSYLDHDSMRAISSYRGAETEGRFDLTWKGWSRQRWLLGLSYSETDTDRAKQARPDPGEPIAIEYGALSRRLWSAWVQDQITLSDGLTVTAGLRFDHFSDVGEDPVNPRLALVWRAGERHLFKAQYAEGFRAPTFWELYMTGERQHDLQAEIVGTSELSYTFRRPGSVARLTLFDSEIHDMIYPSFEGLLQMAGFANVAEARSCGVEAEWAQEITGWLTIDANLSYLDTTEDTRGQPEGTESQVAADWMGNLSVLAKPLPGVIAGLRWQHVGDRNVDIPEGAGYDLVDLTLSWINVHSSGVTLRAGIRNLLDKDRHYLNLLPTGVRTSTYSGRTAWLQVSLRR